MPGSPFRALPSMAGLRALEAVARLKSFTRAGEEMGLSQSAVSHQIRTLERDLGFDLFQRDPHGTTLSALGQELASGVRDGLGRIADALSEARRSDRGPALTLSTLPGFAVKWLFLRLIRFDELHPDIELSITTTARLADFAGGEADCAIRYGIGRYPGLYVEKVLDEDMFPVCAPQLLKGPHALRTSAALPHHSLLHDDIWALTSDPPGWAKWLAVAGVKGVDPRKGRRFTQSNMSLQGAMQGLGVALGRSPLVNDDLEARRLVCPFGPRTPSGYAYYFVCLPRALKQAKVAAFRVWLLAEAATSGVSRAAG